MGNIVRGNGSSWEVSASAYEFDRNQFSDERDTARPLFYMKEDLVGEEFVSREYVRIQGPGEHLNVWDGRVTDEHRRRWPQAYERFRRGEQSTEGTALSKWPALSNNIQMQAQLRALGYICIEDIANMPDGAIHEFHGADEWRKRARHYVQEAQKTQKIAKDAAEKEAADSRMAALEAQIAQLTAALASKPAAETEPVRKKPGRKPKVQEEAPAAA